jgi:hypothetical protein
MNNRIFEKKENRMVCDYDGEDCINPNAKSCEGCRIMERDKFNPSHDVGGGC